MNNREARRDKLEELLDEYFDLAVEKGRNFERNGLRSNQVRKEILSLFDLASQAQQDHFPNVGKMVEVSEHGEGQENDCPECGAEAGSSCSSDEGIEYGRRVHEARQSQVQQQTDLSKQLQKENERLKEELRQYKTSHRSAMPRRFK